MFERVVVGVDPGTAATGLAVVAGRKGAAPRVLSAETIRTRSSSAESDRLRAVYLAVSAVLRSHHPAALAVERLMWGKNVGSAMGVSRAIGVVLLASAELGIPVHEYAPLEVKMAVTGNGAARKEDVRRMLGRTLRIEGVPDEPDAADAVAVAVCHLAQAPLQAAEGRPVISFVEGTLTERSGDRVVVAAGGIGYEVLVPAGTMAALPPTGRKTRLLTHLHVREDGMTLFGFAAPPERELFLHLLGVTGIGPKVALAILSVLSADALRRAILDGDADAITVVPGVGKKVAARIVLDLRDRLGGEVVLPDAGPMAEVREALAGLGLTPQEVHRAMDGLSSDGEPVEDLLRRALQQVGAPT